MEQTLCSLAPAVDLGCDSPENQASPRCDSVPAALSEAVELADGIEGQMVFLNQQLAIVAANRAWKADIQQQAEGLSIGADYLGFYRSRATHGDRDADMLAAALQCVTAGSLSHFEHVDTDPAAGSAFRVNLSSFEMAGQRWVMVTRYDVSDLFALQRQKIELADLLLRAQDQERRRLARDLHDSTSQDLVALQHSLGRLKRRLPKASRSFTEITDQMKRLQRDIRSLSYIYHPPELRELGLAGAIQALCDGFSRRTTLQVNLMLDYPETRDAQAEMVLYRLAQEAFANIQRRACATQVDVHLVDARSHSHLMIHDDDTGFDPVGADARLGVGIASMRKRVDELGGRLSFHCTEKGSSVIAHIPFIKPPRCGCARHTAPGPRWSAASASA